MKKRKKYKFWAIFGDYGGPFMETIAGTRGEAIDKFCGNPRDFSWESAQRIGRTVKKIEMTIVWVQ